MASDSNGDGQLSGSTVVSPAEPPPVVWGLGPTVGWSFLIAGIFLGAQIIVSVLYVAVYAIRLGVGEFEPPDLENEVWEQHGLLLALATLAAMPVTVAACCLCARARRTITVRQYLHLHHVPWRVYGRWGLLLVVLIAAIDGLTIALGKPVVPEVIQAIHFPYGTGPLLWLALIVGAPLSEEFFFRGFLFEGLAQSRLGVWPTIVITSLLWAAIHLQYDAYGIGCIFVGGLFIGWARVKTGSLLVPIALHAAMNLVASIQAMIEMGRFL